MSEIVKKISVLDTLKAMRAKSTVCIPYSDVKSSTVYNSVRIQNQKCGWKQWEARLINEDNGSSFYRIMRYTKSDAEAKAAKGL